MTDEFLHHVRTNEQLQLYWQELRGSRAYPQEDEVNTEDLKEIWDWCFLVVKRKNGFAYEYLGKHLLDAYGDDFTGREITETLIYPHPDSLFKAFQRVVASGAAELDEGEFVNVRGDTIKHRSCILPLGEHGVEGVSFILGSMKWKAY